MYESASISAQNTFTIPVAISGDFNVSISGTWVGSVTLQRSFDSGDTWLDVRSWSANLEGHDTEPTDKGRGKYPTVKYRLGFKAGEYTSGTAVCRVGQG